MSYKSILFLALLMIFASVNSEKTFMKMKQSPPPSSSSSGSTTNSQSSKPSNNFTIAPNDTVIEISGEQAFCYLNSNGTIYDINPLHKSNSDYYINETLLYSVNFNVCQNTVRKCNNRTSLVSYRSIVSGVESDQCVELAGSATVLSNWTVIEDLTKNTTTLKMVLPEGDYCDQAKTKNYTTTMFIQCDPKASNPVIETKSVNIYSCENSIYLRSKDACAQFNVFAFWNAIMNNKYAFGSIVIVAGIFFCFFGIKFIEITEVLCGVVATTLIIICFLFAHLKVEYSTLTFWLIIAVASLSGLIVGYFIARFKRLPVVFLGHFLGFLLGTVLYQLALKYIHINPEAVYWVTVIFCVIAAGVVAWFFYKHILVIGTSFIGAYAIVRGISFMAGHFPDERQIIDLIKHGEWAQVEKMMDWQVYVYLVCIILLGILGTTLQYFYFYKDYEEREKERDRKREHKDTKKHTEKGEVNESLLKADVKVSV